MFFRVGYTSFPISSVVEIRRDREGEGGEVLLADGRRFDLSDRRLEQLSDSYPLHVLPAAPGTALLVFHEHAKVSTEHTKWPIIGWAVHADGGVSSITSAGVTELPNWPLILHPNGLVERRDDTVFEDIDAAFLAEQQRLKPGS